MKTNTFLLLSLITLLSSCDKEDNQVIPGNPVSAKYLTIVPSIIDRPETKAGITNTFKADDRLGLYVSGANTYNNIPAEFDGSKWALKEIEGAKALEAYFPYSAEYETVDAVPVNIQDQTDYLYSGYTPVTNNLANLKMKHAMSLVSIIVKKNDYNYEGKITQLEIEGIPTTGEINLKSGKVNITGKPVTYKRTLNYTMNDYNPEKISTIVLPVALVDLKDVTIRVIVDEVGWSFGVHSSHVWEAGKEYTYTLNMYKTFKPEVMDVVPVDVSYWNTYGKTDKITILDKPNQNLWVHSGAASRGKMTVKGEGQIFGARITNTGATDWEGQWRYGMFDMSGKLVELYQVYNISIPKDSYDGGEIPCFVDCVPGKYKALPLLKDKGTDYWYIPRLQYEGLDEYTVLPTSANLTPSIRSERIEGWYEAYPGYVYKKYHEPFNMIITITNRAGVPLKGEIKAVHERILTPDFIPYPLSYMEAMGWNTELWADEIGRISINYTSDVKIQQEIMSCIGIVKRPNVDICAANIHWYYKPEGSNIWTLMRCDFDHLFEKLKGISDFRNKREDGWDIGLLGITIDNPAKNYAGISFIE